MLKLRIKWVNLLRECQVYFKMYPSTIKNLIECFKKFPSIGEKTAERLSLSALALDEDVINL